jgi:hypothetical protein
MPTLAEFRNAIEAPVGVTPHPYGVDSVVAATTPGDSAWMIGVEWASDVCGGARYSDASVCDDATDNYTIDRWCKLMGFDPFTVYSWSETSTLSRRSITSESQALTRLRAGEQAAVERKLRAQLAAAVPSPTAVAVTGYAGLDKLRAGLAWVESKLRGQYPGNGVVHLDVFTASLLGDHLRPQGSRLFTTLGTPVVVEATTGDDGVAVPTTSVIYGTGPLVMFRGSEDVTSVLNRDVNDWLGQASRTYLIGWDCTAVGATVTL